METEAARRFFTTIGRGFLSKYTFLLQFRFLLSHFYGRAENLGNPIGVAAAVLCASRSSTEAGTSKRGRLFGGKGEKTLGSFTRIPGS
jgi:hypothetical protein